MRFAQIAVFAIIAVAAFTAAAPTASAQDSKFVNLALWDPVQIFDRDTPIHGFRLNIYGVNSELHGVDIGIANWITGEVKGIQWGLINMAKGPMTGWQTAPVNLVEGHVTGVQSGIIFSRNPSGKGLMASGVTYSDNFVGLQLGIVNYAVEYHGIQLGLVNIIKNGGMLPVFPFFNFSFDE